MKVAVLADDDGYIVALAHCRISDTGQPGTFTRDVEIWAEITRASLDAHRGHQTTGNGDDVISSIVIDLPDELSNIPLDQIRSSMLLDRSGATPTFVDKPAAD
jgi:hypothetical protein